MSIDFHRGTLCLPPSLPLSLSVYASSTASPFVSLFRPLCLCPFLSDYLCLSVCPSVSACMSFSRCLYISPDVFIFLCLLSMSPPYAGVLDPSSLGPSLCSAHLPGCSSGFAFSIFCLCASSMSLFPCVSFCLSITVSVSHCPSVTLCVLLSVSLSV